MALALGEDRHQDVGAGDLLAARGLDVDDGALDDPLEAGGRLRILVVAGHQIVELGVDVGQHRMLQLVEIDVAGPHHGGRLGIVDQRQQQVLERRIFMMTLVGERQRLMQRLFQALGESRHSKPHFFSITHCSGCWFCRAKSITCDTLVSATSNV